MRILLKRSVMAAATGALAFAGACKEATSVPDLNNLSDAAIANGLTRSTLQLLATGLLNRDREANNFRYLVFGNTLARNVYNIDPSENRYITELLGVPIDPGSFTGGSGGTYTENYNAIRTANTILDNLQSAGLSTQEAAATRGFARTMKALAYYRALELRGPNGIPIDVNKPITADPAPFVCEPAALAAISALLDTAATDLGGAGTSFPFTLPAGFSSNGTYNTPAGFLRFNRGLKGRTEVYRGILARRAQSYTDAIAALNTALGGATGTPDLTAGVYYTYSTAPGDISNPLAAATIFLNPSVGDSIQAGDRRASKIRTVARATRSGVSTTYQSPLTAATNLTDPLALLRNAELVLLRAQAKIGLGDLAGATQDVNLVRTTEGGLAPLPTFTSERQAIDAVLYEKRYSLLLQGVQRLTDLRAYGRLNRTFLRQETTADQFNAALPIPKTETDARGGTAVTCQ